MMSPIQQEDYQSLLNQTEIEWNQLQGKTFLITGSTGLIGSNLVYMLLYANDHAQLNSKLVLLVRNESRAQELFGMRPDITYLETDVQIPFSIEGNIDYIIHAASQTSSQQFINQPVETLQIAYQGTKNILDFARAKQVKKIIYLSSMEVYGTPQKGHTITENEIAGFDTTTVRNSYPISKLACEALCSAYHSEYRVPSIILRLTQTFGPGVKYNDGRVFAQFMSCALEQQDIVLKTAGQTERCYLYTSDAISAILIALTKAVPGEAYTVANPTTYCSIWEMADLVANQVCNGKIKVVVDISANISSLGYADTLYMQLDTQKMNALGWQPKVDLKDMYTRMILSFQRQ